MAESEKSIGGYIRDIAEEVRQERDRQARLCGDEEKKNTPNDWAAYLTYYIGKATGDEFAPERFRENMLKVAALAQAAMLMIDIHDGCVPRHYEGLPRLVAREIEWVCPRCTHQNPDTNVVCDCGCPKPNSCTHCGWAMGEREGKPQCLNCKSGE